MDKDNTVLIRVEPMIYSDDIWVLIPAKFWKRDGIAEGIKKAVLMTTKPEENKHPSTY